MKKALGLSFVLALGVTACSNPVEEIDEEVDCSDICNRYRECYDDGYDVATCEARCGGVVDGEDPGRADMCDACLDVSDCVEAAFDCTAECNGLLP